MADDILSVKARVRAILNRCNHEEVLQIYEFCKQFKSGTQNTQSAATQQAAPAQQQYAPQPPRPEVDVQFDYLCGKWMHFVGAVAQWIYDDYFNGKSSESYEDILQATKVCYAAMMPVRLIAAEGPEVIASISIVKHELDDINLTPLLTFLVTHPNYKNCGVEQKLIRHSAKILKGLGHKKMYITADKRNYFPDDMLWEPVENVQGIYKYNIS